MSSSAGKRTASKPTSDAADKEKKKMCKESAKELNTRCAEACYHAAFCGRGPPGGTRLPPNASYLNFAGVLAYLVTSPPIDHVIPHSISELEGYVDLAGAFHSPLIKAAVAEEWDNMESRNKVEKRAIFEMVLLAGATVDKQVYQFAGTAMTEAGGGVHYSADYTHSVLDKCTATPAARLARWPEVLAEISAAASGSAQYAVIRRRFLEICCEGKVDEATLEKAIDSD